MDFFNSLSIRIPLALVGGILYGLLTYYLIILLDSPSQFAILGSIFVFLFYLGSRLLILFSGIDSPYYSRERGKGSTLSIEKNSFYWTTQWVGKFYHYHDIVLFPFLAILSIVFLITLIVDWSGESPMSSTFQSIWNAFICPF